MAAGPTQQSACPDRPRRLHVRYLPLGSPWTTPKQLLAVSPRGAVRDMSDQAWYRVGTGRVVYRVQYPPSTRYTHPSGLHWYCQGPTDASRPRFCVRQALRALSWALRTPGSSHSAGYSLGPNRARFRYIYLKVSINRGVSPKFVHEAWHSPCFKKGSRMSRP